MSVDDICRLCKVNMRASGILSCNKNVFDADKEKEERSVSERLALLGLTLSEDASKSSRICTPCFRLLGKLEYDFATFRKWKEENKETSPVTSDEETSERFTRKDSPKPTTPAHELRLGNNDSACEQPKTADGRRTTNQSENGDTEEDEDEEVSTSLSVGDGRYLVDLGSQSEIIVDEECLLQLFQSCRECSKQCRVKRRVQGLKIKVDQKCCFCESRHEWTNLSDDESPINGTGPVRGQTDVSRH